MRTIRVIDGRLRGREGGAFLVEDGKPGEAYFPDQDVDDLALWYVQMYPDVLLTIKRYPSYPGIERVALR